MDQSLAERSQYADGMPAFPSTVDEALGAGEGQHVEFKAAMPKQARDLATEIAAFASSGGGWILLGVDDAGRVVGFDAALERVEGIVKLVDPSPSVTVWIESHGQVPLCVIRVAAGETPPYFVESRPYVRRGSLSEPASPDEVRRLARGTQERPRFAIVPLGHRVYPDGIEPSWRLEHIGGDMPPFLEWRFRSPRLEPREWRQVNVPQLARAHISDNLRFSDVPGDDDLVGTEELGLEVRSVWRDSYSYELFRIQLVRQQVSGGEKWRLGDQRPPRTWTTPIDT
ncbi:MAG: ATP-binding protein [Dehalococcoidia bacterium]